jgi:molybdate transport system substrate-binding protein
MNETRRRIMQTRKNENPKEKAGSDLRARALLAFFGLSSFRVFVVSWLAAMVAGEFAPAGPSWAAGSDKVVVIFAAASTGGALDEIKDRYTRQSGTRIVTSYAATSTLVQQVENGADAQLLLSANTKWADYLEAKGLVARRKDLLGNRLVLVVPQNSKLVLSKLEDLVQAEVMHVALGDPEAVPAGIYAKKALVKRNLWDRLKSKIVAADDVEHALAFVETGSAEAGFVYATDAAASTKVKVAAAISPELTGPVAYPLLLLKKGAASPDASSFFRYLDSAAAAEVFRKHGFDILPPHRESNARSAAATGK